MMAIIFGKMLAPPVAIRLAVAKGVLRLCPELLTHSSGQAFANKSSSGSTRLRSPSDVADHLMTNSQRTPS